MALPTRCAIRRNALKTRHTNKLPALKAGVAPGAILILVAGKFAGKRVVCLKQLESGLLLVSGPSKVNGVPMIRVNQKFVIATSTKIDVSKVDVSAAKDCMFKKAEEKCAEYKPLQKAVDAALLEEINKEALLKQYLATPFSLSKGQLPHNMKF